MQADECPDDFLTHMCLNREQRIDREHTIRIGGHEITHHHDLIENVQYVKQAQKIHDHSADHFLLQSEEWKSIQSEATAPAADTTAAKNRVLAVAEQDETFK